MSHCLTISAAIDKLYHADAEVGPRMDEANKGKSEHFYELAMNKSAAREGARVVLTLDRLTELYKAMAARSVECDSAGVFDARAHCDIIQT